MRHNLRKLVGPYAQTAWNALRAAERLRLRYGREKLVDLFEAADELSAHQARSVPAGTWDFFHVAAALYLRAECFATCDRLQADLARSVGGLGRVKLFEP